jgi:menaquinol-cytochrome c reductase iron-sulfur subunit
MSFVDRRRALARLVSVGLGVMGAALAGLVGAAATPRSSARTPRWRRAAASFDLPSDGPLAVVLAERHADGWYETRKESVVYVDRDGDGFRALSATCTHLGCRVTWQPGARQFQCPCHGGVYDRAGRVVSGPPPSPLGRVNVRLNPATSDLEVDL